MKLVSETIAAVKRWQYWLFLGARDVVAPYRRSVLGVFWVYIQTLIWFGLIGVVFVPIFQPVEPLYFSYFAVGYILFQYVSSSISGASNLFFANRGLLLNIPIPMFAVLLRQGVANLVTLALTLPIAIGVFVLDGVPAGAHLAWAALGLLPVIVAVLSVSVVFAYIGAFVPDFAFAVQSVMRVLFFGTPIIWLIEQRDGLRGAIAELNPLTHMLALVRDPIVHQTVPADSYLIVIGGTFIMIVLSVGVVELLRDRVILRL
jgi:ABC-type polysaccharide/polyol phosphate export permease